MSAPGTLDPLQISKLKVADLRKELKTRGLSIVGNKTELLERLQEAIHIADETLESGDVDDENAEDIFLEDDVLADDRPEDSSLNDDTLGVSVRTDESGISLLGSPEIETSKSSAMTETKGGEKDENVLTVKSVQSLSAQEKLELRSKRFNLPMTEEARKQARAERFGITRPVLSNSSFSANKNSTESLVKRAQRFGMPLPKVAQQKIDKEKLQERAERFGVQPRMDDKTKLLKRKEKFGTVATDLELEEKKKKRAERFGIKTL